MRRIIFIVFIFLFSFCVAVENPILKSYKTYNKSAESVFLDSFNAITSNKYEIVEFQSRGGYILFRVNKKEYLLTVIKDNTNSLVKIVPEDMDYASSLGVFDSIFKALDGVL